jgi:hypothetical protein
MSSQIPSPNTRIKKGAVPVMVTAPYPEPGRSRHFPKVLPGFHRARLLFLLLFLLCGHIARYQIIDHQAQP